MRKRLACVGLLVSFAWTSHAVAAEVAPAIEAEPVAGQLDVLQATAVQLHAKIDEGRPAPTGFRWRIVQGKGAQLYSEDQATAVFLGPKLDDGIRIFIVELTVSYADEPPSTSRVQILVHARSPDGGAAPAAPPDEDPNDTSWLDDFYRDARAREEEKKSRSPVLVPGYTTGPTTSIGVWGSPGGWGVGMGFTFRLSYPVAVPVEVPPPGQSLEPGQGNHHAPRPVPYDELVTTFPESISERYLPQDNPFHGTAFPSYRSSSFARQPGEDKQKKLVDPAFAADSIGW